MIVIMVIHANNKVPSSFFPWGGDQNLFAPAVKCLDAPSLLVKTPVDSMIKSISHSFQGKFLGCGQMCT